VLPRLNRKLQVWVWVEEHPLLQSQGLDVWHQGPGIYSQEGDRYTSKEGLHMLIKNRTNSTQICDGKKCHQSHPLLYFYDSIDIETFPLF
jgi:hypothetical protein